MWEQDENGILRYRPLGDTSSGLAGTGYNYTGSPSNYTVGGMSATSPTPSYVVGGTAAPSADFSRADDPETTTSWQDGNFGRNLATAQIVGSLGLGLASFLDQRKTAGLQRASMRENLNMAREHQANRRALSDSWNKGWGQS